MDRLCIWGEKGEENQDYSFWDVGVRAEGHKGALQLTGGRKCDAWKAIKKSRKANAFHRPESLARGKERPHDGGSRKGEVSLAMRAKGTDCMGCGEGPTKSQISI